MKVAFLEYVSEHCKEPWQQEKFVNALASYGLDVVPHCDSRCNVALSFALRNQDRAWDVLHKHPGVKLITYCWDLYDCLINEPDPAYDYPRYFNLLKRSAEVWCPSFCTARQIDKYTGVKAKVIKSNIWPWPASKDWIKNGPYVMNVMRKYCDPNRDIVENACKRWGIKCVSPNHTLSFDDFRKTVCGAMALVSGYVEASTGGLTLLEGYRHGKIIIASESPMNGVRDYFGARPGVFYFNHKDQSSLEDLLEQMALHKTRLAPELLEEAKFWVDQEYSIQRMAAEIFDRIRTVRYELEL